MAGCSEAGQTKPLSLGEVLRRALPDFSQSYRLPAHHWKVLRALSVCQTPALGGHLYRCAHCGQDHFVPHCCGNRHCPSCQKLNGAQWLEGQVEDLLPIPYFHSVFTLPHQLNLLIRHNQRVLYDLLFSSATSTLLEFGRNNLQATLGITAVLHTWSQDLQDHYHLHCLVTGGGLSLDGRAWVSVDPKWLFPVRALSVVFRAKFRDGLRELFEQGLLRWPSSLASLAEPSLFEGWLSQLCQGPWVVYAKRPFAGPKAVLAYLCRYTHRVAISNRRLEKLDLQAGTICFRYKDYAQGSQIRSMTLPLGEFLRRFCLHILPERFVKIRSYGLLCHRERSARLERVRALLGQGPALAQPLSPETWVIQPAQTPALVCPHCGESALILIGEVPRPKDPLRWDSS